MFNDVLPLAQELMACPSVSPDDAGCQDILMARLSRHGFRCVPINFGDVKNFWATHGSGEPFVCFAGHTDVVPPGPSSSWRFPPFEPTMADGYLYGRGACDMKAALAALVVAAERFVDQYPDHPGTVCFIVTSDEEKDADDGSVRVVDWLRANHMHLDFCIVGEPVSQKRLGDNIKNGARGSLSFHFDVLGKQGHVSYDDSDNACHRTVPFLHTLMDHHWDDGDDFFEKTTLQITGLAAGVGADNVVPGVCSVSLNLRYCPCHAVDSIKNDVESMISAWGVPLASAQWIPGAAPYYSPSGRLAQVLANQCKKILHAEPTVTTIGGASDGRFIVSVCSEVVEFGLLRDKAHQLNESVRIDDLPTLAHIYYATLYELLYH